MKSAATRAMWGLMRQVQDRDIQQISIRVLLFKTMVLPIMSYGCEIWSLPYLKVGDPFENPLQKVQNLFLIQAVGVGCGKQYHGDYCIRSLDVYLCLLLG
jgi:hypothetical protein